jgi:ParB family chromosome partitioning protein
MAQWLAPTAESRIERIVTARIRDRRWWPADDADPETQSALRSSIASRGIVEPLLLRRQGSEWFEVVCGARRLRAAQELNQDYVPAIVRELSDREALLVAAWTTVERRRAEGIDDPAALQQLLAAGLSPAEAGLLAAHPATVWRNLAIRIPPFVLRARPLSTPRSIPRFAPFFTAAASVLPLDSSPELNTALRVLDNVRPAALVT